MFQVAIVGCGAISAVHADAIRRLPQVTPVGCVDPVEDRARALAGQLNCAAYPSLPALLAEQTPDVLHLCTPHYLHVPMALTAFEHGMAVVCEKPVGITAKELHELVAAEQAGGKIGVCFQNRYNTSVRQALALIKGGFLGRLKGARAFVTWQRDDRYYLNSGWRGKWATEGGGVMVNQAIHTLDLLQLMAGTPTSVFGQTANHHLPGVIEVEDTAAMYMTLPGGAPALFYATTAYGEDAHIQLELTGDAGALRIEGDRLFLRQAGEAAFTPAGEAAAPAGFVAEKSCWGTGHAALIADFYDCLATGRPFAINAAEAARAPALFLALYQSAKTGKPVAPEAF